MYDNIPGWAVFLLISVVGALLWAWNRNQAAAESSKGIDAALGLAELPPIRLPVAIAAQYQEAAEKDGLVAQAYIRKVLIEYAQRYM